MANTPTPISDLPATTALADDDLVIVQKANGNTSKMTGAKLKEIVTPPASTWSGTTGKPFDEVGSGLNISLSGSTKKLNANAPSWASVAGKPFSSVGNGLTVENDQLKSSPTWGSVDGKPFSSVEQGGGLSVENGALKLSDDPSVFNATYGSTPYSDIVSAYNAARPITATDENGRIAYLVALTSARATFQTSKQSGGNSIIFYSVDTSDQWTSSPVPISGGSGESGIFYAIYGETTYEEIEDAYNSGYDVRLSPATSLGIVIDGVTIVPHITQLKTIEEGEARFSCLGRGIKTIILPTPSTQKKVVLFAAICDADGWQTSVITEFVTSVNDETGDVTVSGGGGGVYSFTVTTDANDYVFLQSGVTVDSILSAYNSGKQIQCVLGNQTYTNPSVYTSSSSKFIYFSLLNAGRNASPICETITISNVETTGNGHSSYSYLTDGRTYSPVIKTDAMTQEVGLDRNTGRLWTSPGSASGVFTFSVSETNSVVYLQNGVTVANIYAAWVTGKQIRCKYSNTTFICQAMWGTSASNADFVFSRLYVSKSGHASVEFIFIQAQASEGNGYRSFAYLIDSLEYNPAAKTSAMTKEVGCDYDTGKLWTTP